MPLTTRQRSIHSKNGSKRTASFNKGRKSFRSTEREYLVSNAPTDLKGIAFPGGAVTLGLLLFLRIGSALWAHISDCDESYNYWEPLHFLIYGSGLQTWEYSPLYAIRSYMPLWLFAFPAKILAVLVSPITIFYVIRVLLAVLTAFAELSFYKSICHEFGVHVGRTWLAFTLPSAASFVSCSAMLPSAWSNALIAAALALAWRRRYPPAIVLVAASAILSWPFTALLGLPIAIDMIILKKKTDEFFKWSLVALITLLMPAVALDSLYYGKFVIAPWNIVFYNIFTNHGPDLYGVEPWTYYFVNGFLNFNIVWVLSLACPVLLLACQAATRAAPRPAFCTPYWLSLMPLYLWLAIFMLQPHKEERFLYPVYSLIALTGAISLDCLQKLVFAVRTELFRNKSGRGHYLSYTAPLMLMCLFCSTALGISRIYSLTSNYSGPMSILQNLPPSPNPSHPSSPGGIQYVCFGKEWYRSPSSFHLPDAGYRIRFVRSDFNGQMPAQYDTRPNATRIIHPYFNDLNKEDTRTYLPPSKCHYLVDSDLGKETKLQPAYHRQNSTWEIVNRVSLIDAANSHRVLRAFYVPVLSARNTVFGNLFLLKNRKLFSGSS